MNPQFNGCDSILCAHLLRKVDEKLIKLLRSISPDEWEFQALAPAVESARCGGASLGHGASEALAGSRFLSIRDRRYAIPPQDLIALVNRLYREGVTVYRRLSANAPIDLMAVACEQSARFQEPLDPFARAAFAVSWAGEDTSLNWFDKIEGSQGLGGTVLQLTAIVS